MSQNTWLDGIDRSWLKEVREEQEILVKLLNLEVGLYEALRGYDDWLAAKIIRSNNYERQQLPAVDYNALSERFGVPKRILEEVVEQVSKSGTVLPLSGIVQGTEIIPNKEILQKYKTLFDWS